MCGICASVAGDNQIPSVLDGLRKLDYRGYDACGVGYINDEKIQIVKSVGQVKNLEKKLSGFISNLVIGHTRWATHGKVSEENSHPHISQDGKVAIVHNGIVENFEDLKSDLKDINFYSQTDTEVFANLIAKKDGDPLHKLMSACKEVVGSFAIAMLFDGDKKIYLAKRNSPLAVAVGDGVVMASSDISVFAGKFEFCYILEDDEFAVFDAKNIDFFNKNGKKIEKKRNFIKDFDFFDEKSDEKYLMLKEIKEQPIVLRRTYFEYFSKWQNLDFEVLSKFKSFHFIACGTAYHSSLMGADFIQNFCKKEAKVSIASEFRYSKNIYSKNCLYIFVSQSGETADTIACAKLVKEKGLKTLAVTNVPYSSLNSVVDFVLPTFAGREVAVASTKAYTAQVFTLLIFSLLLSKYDKKEQLNKFVHDFKICDFSENLFKYIFKYRKIFFIGRQQDYITALEGSLKLKEIAYVNCMGLAGGELKHGTLALIDDETLVIAISTQKKLKEKMESNIQEVKARGGKILLISQFEHNIEVDYKLKVDDFDEFLMPIISIVPLQLLALNFATRLGYNPDKPRNLAKSVTVE